MLEISTRNVLILVLFLSMPQTTALFNYDITPRIISEIKINLEPARQINGLNRGLFSIGAVSLNDKPALRRFNFATTVAFSEMAMVYAGFEDGFFYGHMRDTHSFKADTYRYTQVDIDPNDLNLIAPHPERLFWKINNVSGANEGSSIKRITTYQHRLRPWYVEAKARSILTPGQRTSMWSSLYIFSDKLVLGITHLEVVLHPTTSNFQGVLATDLSMQTIQEWLIESYRGSANIIFITENLTGKLVASSNSKQPLLRQDPLDENKWKRVHSTKSIVPEIAKAAKFLANRGWNYRNSLDIIDDMFIEYTTFEEGEIQWKMIVLQPAICAAGTIIDQLTHECVTCLPGSTKRDISKSIDLATPGTDTNEIKFVSLGGDCACQPSWQYQGTSFLRCSETADWPGNKWCYVIASSCVLASESRRGFDSTDDADDYYWRTCEAGDESQTRNRESVVLHPCESCDAGKYKDQSGDQACTICPQDTYGEKIGATSDGDCTKCDFRRTTNAMKNTDKTACVCRKEQYFRDTNNQCTACPLGADCSMNNNLSIVDLNPMAGHWRNNNQSLVFNDCRNYHKNEIIAKERCSVNNGTLRCKIGYNGAMCKACDIHFLPVGDTCISCYGKESILLTIAVLLGLVFVPISIIMIFILLRTHSQQKHSSNSFRLLGMMKILISFAQVTSSLTKSMQGINWPQSFVDLTAILGVLNLDFFAILPQSNCRMALGGGFRFLVAMCMPIFLGCSVFAGYLVVKIIRPTEKNAMQQKTQHRRYLQSIKCSILGMLLLYPSTATRIFGIFVCKSVPSVAGSYLQDDWRIKCYEGNHATIYVPLGVFFLIVYVLGLPTLIFYMLFSKREALHDTKGEKYEDIKFELGGLFLQFEKPYWWFEIVVIIWKMFMTGALCIIGPDTAAQPLVATVFQLVYAAFILKLAPFESDFDDLASFIAASAMVMILILASAIFMDGQVDVEEQLYNTFALEVALMTLTIGALVLQMSIMMRVIIYPSKSRTCSNFFVQQHLVKKKEEDVIVEMQVMDQNPMTRSNKRSE